MSSEEQDPARPADPVLPAASPPDSPPVPPAPPAANGELPYESTVTAPTRWVPYVYSERELQAVTSRRGLATASVVFGLLGLIGGVFGIWGAPLSAIATVLALIASVRQRWAWLRWALGLATGLVGLLLTAGWVYYTTAVIPRLWGR